MFVFVREEERLITFSLYVCVCVCICMKCQGDMLYGFILDEDVWYTNRRPLLKASCIIYSCCRFIIQHASVCFAGD